MVAEWHRGADRSARQPHTADTERVLGPSAPSPHWAALYQDTDELQALRYVRARTSPSTPIFVGVPNHSRVYWSNLRIYWLSGRPIGTKTFHWRREWRMNSPSSRGSSPISNGTGEVDHPRQQRRRRQGFLEGGLERLRPSRHPHRESLRGAGPIRQLHHPDAITIWLSYSLS